MKKHRIAKKQTSFIEIMLFGIIFSFCSLLIFTMLLSGLIMSSSNPGASAKNLSLVSLLISGAVSGFAISKRKGEGGISISLFTSLIFTSSILIISLIASKGRIGGVIFMNCLCYILTSTFASFLAKKRERRHKR